MALLTKFVFFFLFLLGRNDDLRNNYICNFVVVSAASFVPSPDNSNHQTSLIRRKEKRWSSPLRQRRNLQQHTFIHDTSIKSNNNNNDNNSQLSNDEISRYSRHLVLNDVGMVGQKTLKQSSVLVIGAGGLGSPCLLYLAAAGVGRIGIVDSDVVDESNLQRQIIHGTSTVSVSKCQSALQRIKDINPYVNVQIYEKEFTSQTAMSILKDGEKDQQEEWDVVIDGSDNFPTKYLINDACDICGVPWIYSAILAFEGQISTFNYPPSVGPTYRDLLPTPPPPGDVPSCAEGGVLGVLPGTMGCLQATEAIKLILGHTDGLLTGRVLIFDALQMKFKEVTLTKNKDSDVITELIDYQGFCAGPSTTKETKSQPPTTIKTPVLQTANGATIVEGVASMEQEAAATTTTTTTLGQRTMDENEEATHNDKGEASTPTYNTIEPKDCLIKLSNGWSPFVLDVRLQTEHDITALPFTDNVVPHRSVSRNDIPKNGDVLLYCKGGIRSKKAISTLINTYDIEPKRLFNLNGGIMKWQKDIDNTMPRY